MPASPGRLHAQLMGASCAALLLLPRCRAQALDDVSLIQIGSAPVADPHIVSPPVEVEEEQEEPLFGDEPEVRGAIPFNHAVHVYPNMSRRAPMTYVRSEDDHKQRLRYADVEELLSANPKLSHSKAIWHYVSTMDKAPALLEGGCLYLPSDNAWKAFYGYLEHPYPPLFVELIANAFYPGCGRTSLSGLMIQSCEAPGEIFSHGVVGHAGCFGARAESHAGIDILVTDGFVGLPWNWSNHVQRVQWSTVTAEAISIQDAQRRAAEQPRTGRWVTPRSDRCSDAGLLPPVPKDHKLVIPTKFVVCAVEHVVDREMLEEQVAWMNAGYAGRTPWTQQSFDMRAPQQTDMQIQFELKEVVFAHDENCAKYGFSQPEYAEVYNVDDSSQLFTILIVADDESGILGMSPFPTMYQEGDKRLLVMVSASGLRHFMDKNPLALCDVAYDEGDTVTHESGHAFGLYHTFQGGCSATGDKIPDTEPEAFPHYECFDGNTCKSPDPVHNFMDYTPDYCLSGFTEMQKRRAWCIFESYRPILYNVSLRH